MKLIITEDKDYEQGKPKVTYWVRIKLTNWREQLSSFFDPLGFNIYDGKGISCFNNLKEARKCKKQFLQNKWDGRGYSKEVE